MTPEQALPLRGIEAEENFPLILSREREVVRVQAALADYPVAFVWAPSGNGKTGFGREFRQRVATSQLILAAQLVRPVPIFPGRPYDTSIGSQTTTLVLDELTLDTWSMYKALGAQITIGRQLVLMMHDPINNFLKWKSRHQRRLDPMIRFIHDHPQALWMYLRKWKPPPGIIGE